MVRRAGKRGFRQTHRKGRALADFALDGDIAAVHLDYLPGDRESESAAAGRAGTVLIDPVEPLEELFHVLFRDADARIPDAHDQSLTHLPL